MKEFFEEALRLANIAYCEDDIPIGAVIVKNNNIIGRGYNKKNRTHKVIDHAEIEAITQAAEFIKDWRLDDCELYVTLEPCNMCKEVIKQSRIRKVYYLVSSNFYNEKNRIIDYIKADYYDCNGIDKYIRKITSFFKTKR